MKLYTSSFMISLGSVLFLMPSLVLADSFFAPRQSSGLKCNVPTILSKYPGLQDCSKMGDMYFDDVSIWCNRDCLRLGEMANADLVSACGLTYNPSTPIINAHIAWSHHDAVMLACTRNQDRYCLRDLVASSIIVSNNMATNSNRSIPCTGCMRSFLNYPTDQPLPELYYYRVSNRVELYNEARKVCGQTA